MVNIMVVEDEKPISNLIALSLKKAGYHSECAYDGLEAIDMLEKNYPDLILLDIMLPGADVSLYLFILYIGDTFRINQIIAAFCLASFLEVCLELCRTLVREYLVKSDTD